MSRRLMAMAVALATLATMAAGAEVGSVAEWRARADEIRPQALRLLGITDLDECFEAPVVTALGDVRRGEGYTLVHVVLSNSRNAEGVHNKITAYVLRPTSGRPPYPGVVALHQTVGMGKEEPSGVRGSTAMDYGAELARRGYVVLVPDLLSAGERMLGGRAWDLASYPQPNGLSLVGQHVLDTIACVTWLRGQADVDPDRVGLIGHSQGAITAFIAGALDDRVAATVANNGFMTFRGDPRLERWRNLVPLALESPPIDLDDIAALTAPRPLMLINALQDEIIPITPGILEAQSSLAARYRLYRRPDNFRMILCSGEHGFPDSQRELAYEFLDQHLKQPSQEIAVARAIADAVAFYDQSDWSVAGSSFRSSADIPAHYALAFLTISQETSDAQASRRAVGCLSALLRDPDANRDGHWGWGLNEAWDAFGGANDGTVNPADAEYAYTSALVGMAFVEAWQVFRDRQYLDAALRTADGIVDGIGYTKLRGDQVFFHYSNTAADAPYEVPNVSAYVGSFLIRAGILADRPDLVRLGRSALDRMVSLQRKDGTWPYCIGSPQPNDAVHFAMIVRSLTEAWLLTGEQSYRKAAEAGARALALTVYKEGRLVDLGSYAWAPGEVLIALSLSEHALNLDLGASKIVDAIIAGEAEGVFFSNPSPRGHSWVLYGLAYYWNQRWRGDLLTAAPTAR